MIANQNIHAIEKYFDENIDASIDAKRFFDLLEMETTVYYNLGYVQMDSKDVDESYRYIADAYIQNKLNSNMSYDEIITVQNNLIELLERDVNPSSNLLRTNVIEEEFTNYINTNSINNNRTK